MAREDLHFRLRIPEELKKKVEEAASKNQRSMTAEIIDRLQLTFHADELKHTEHDPVKAAYEITETVLREVKHQSEVLDWMKEQQASTGRLLEAIAKTDGHLSQQTMDILRGMLGRRGTGDIRFPKHPDDEE